ncbi:hypothetical protein BJX65DRAFT_245522 [Aspergillus insuetus]
MKAGLTWREVGSMPMSEASHFPCARAHCPVLPISLLAVPFALCPDSSSTLSPHFRAWKVSPGAVFRSSRYPAIFLRISGVLISTRRCGIRCVTTTISLADA